MLSVVVDFSSRESRAQFIRDWESSLYIDTVPGSDIISVRLQQGKGMEVLRLSRDNWIEITEYDENGYEVGVVFEVNEK